MAADKAKTGDQETKVMKAEKGVSGHPHTGWVKTLVVVATLLTIIACFAVWVQRQALETNEWVNTSGKLLQNSDIRDALANYSVDQLYANVDVEGYIKPLLPKDIQAAAGPASTGLRQLAVDGAQKVLATDRFQQLWENANRAAHERLIAIIEDKSSVISTGGGEVTLKLRPLITQVADQLGLPGNLSQKIPPDVGNLHIISSNDLSLAQTIVKVIRGLALVLTLLALALFGLAIYLSRGYRWVTVLGTGIGLIIAGAVVLILREVAGNIVVDALAADVARPAADAAWSIGTSLLSSIAKSVIVFGVFFLIAAWLASPHRSSFAARRWLAPFLRDYPLAIGATIGVIALIWVLSGLDSTRALLTRLILLAMLAYGIYALRKRTIGEFPEAKMGDMPERVKERAGELWERRSRPAPAAPDPEPEDRRLDRLERIGDLHEKGILSDEEFTDEKTALLKKPATD